MISAQLVKQQLVKQRWQLTNKRLFLPVTLIALLLSPNTQALTIQVLSDAFWQVSAYVAATLAIYNAITVKLGKDNTISRLIDQHSSYQVLFATLMGALPGCGGAIVVITQYVRGKLSFGSVVAVLTATMGDAAFLLIAAKPSIALLVIVTSMVVGAISGLVVDKIHGNKFMRPCSDHELDKRQQLYQQEQVYREQSETGIDQTSLRLQGKFWQWLLFPSIAVALLYSFQVDIEQALTLPANTMAYLGAVAAIIAMILWATTREVVNYQTLVSEDPKAGTSSFYQKVAQDTNFVTSWVISAFLLFELVVFWSDINVANSVANLGVLTPLVAVIIGLLPGCGPQIIVTSLYISDALPLSAQLGNAISNDGDALFPAIALAPKAAVMATLYSTIPALMVAYGYFYLFE